MDANKNIDTQLLENSEDLAQEVKENGKTSHGSDFRGIYAPSALALPLRGYGLMASISSLRKIIPSGDGSVCIVFAKNSTK